MIEFLNLPENSRRQLIEQTSVRTGMSVKAIEKDWWVTLVLKALFSMPQAEHFIFKGGTSLSKAWKIIERFSEDVDIALAPEAFGRQYTHHPSHSYVKNLKKEGCVYTSTIILNDLSARLAEFDLTPEQIRLEAEKVEATLPDKDPQTLYLHYTSLYDANPYIADRVKVEFGVRSLREPFTTVNIQSIMSEVFPTSTYQEEPFAVTAVEPRKTLLEKLLLLHEKFAAPEAFDVAERQSRHLSDLVKMMDSQALQQAIEDLELHQSLLHHRQYYVRIKGIDYTALAFNNLQFVPPSEAMGQFRTDYLTMVEEMIYDEQAPDFDTLIKRLMELQKLFNGIEK